MLMETYGTRGLFFWAVTFMAIVNVMLVVVSAIHHRDPWVRLPLFTILLSIVVIWAVSARLQNGLAKVCSEVDGKAGLRLQSSAHTLAFMANLAILSVLPLLH
jgi:hypothetical protein